MGPVALQWWKIGSDADQKLLAGSQHILIDDMMFKAACDIFLHTFPNDESSYAPQWTLPAPRVLIEMDHACALIRRRGHTEYVDITYCNPGKEIFYQVGSKSRSRDLWFETGMSEEAEAWLSQIVGILDICLALISEPRIVRASPVPRAMRKRSEKANVSPPALGWHKVGWTVGSETKAKQGAGGQDHSMPLHFCRAHWRRSEPGKPSAEKRPGRNGYWVWVKHSFKGHPDNGIKLHHYMPRVDPSGKSAPIIAATKDMYKEWDASNNQR